MRSGAKAHRRPGRRQCDHLLPAAFEIDLHSRTLRIPLGYVTERIQVKVAVEFTVDSSQDVLIELLGYALCVIVGRNQNLWRLHHVSAQQQSIARAKLIADFAEQRNCLVPIEITNAGTEI